MLSVVVFRIVCPCKLWKTLLSKLMTEAFSTCPGLVDAALTAVTHISVSCEWWEPLQPTAGAAWWRRLV